MAVINYIVIKNKMAKLEKTCLGYVLPLTEKCGGCPKEEQENCPSYDLSPFRVVENKVYEKDWNEGDREIFSECYMVKFGVSKSQIEKSQNQKGFFYDKKHKWYRTKHKLKAD